MEIIDWNLELKGVKPTTTFSVFSKEASQVLREFNLILPESRRTDESKEEFTLTDSQSNETVGSKLNEQEAANTAIQARVSQPGNNGLTCAVCAISFSDVVSQREHFKLDWHRLNLKYQLAGKVPLKEEEFEEHVSDLSSISGSDTEDDTSSEYSDNECDALKMDSQVSGNGYGEDKAYTYKKEKRLESYNKMNFFDSAGNIYFIYKCLLQGKKQDSETLTNYKHVASQISKEDCWILAMLSGGHFAAGVFHGEKHVEHKTFHRYTIRAKRGTTQSVHDNSKFARSAGASVRRYNEAALSENIKELFNKWSDHIAHAKLVFIKYPAHSKAVFFGKGRPFTKDDIRLRKIPFMTRRPTLKEVQKVFIELSQVTSFGDAGSILANRKMHKFHVESPISEKRSDVTKVPSTGDIASGSDEEELSQDCLTDVAIDLSSYRTSNGEITSLSNTVENGEITSVRNTAENGEITSVRNRVKNGDVATKEVRKQAEKFKDGEGQQNACSLDKKGDKKIDEAFGKLSALIEKGDGMALENALIRYKEREDISCSKDQSLINAIPNSCACQGTEVETPSTCECGKDTLLNYGNSSNGQTLLHKAALCGHHGIVWTLMKYGSDPSTCDNRGKTPYQVAKTKEVRNMFRRFMAEYPTKFDYHTAQIPSALTALMEEGRSRKAAEKKKAQKKAKKEKEKTKKAMAEKEDKQKDHITAGEKDIDEREKRARAAERRYGSQLSGNSRCANCTTTIDKRDAFQRLEYLYCSTKCVHEHRTRIGK